MLPALVCLALLAGPAQPGQGVPSPPPPGEGPVILFLVDNSASLPPLDPEAERVAALEKMFGFLQGQPLPADPVRGPQRDRRRRRLALPQRRPVDRLLPRLRQGARAAPSYPKGTEFKLVLVTDAIADPDPKDWADVPPGWDARRHSMRKTVELVREMRMPLYVMLVGDPAGEVAGRDREQSPGFVLDLVQAANGAAAAPLAQTVAAFFKDDGVLLRKFVFRVAPARGPRQDRAGREAHRGPAARRDRAQDLRLLRAAAAADPGGAARACWCARSPARATSRSSSSRSTSRCTWPRTGSTGLADGTWSAQGLSLVDGPAHGRRQLHAAARASSSSRGVGPRHERARPARRGAAAAGRRRRAPRARGRDRRRLARGQDHALNLDYAARELRRARRPSGCCSRSPAERARIPALDFVRAKAHLAFDEELRQRLLEPRVQLVSYGKDADAQGARQGALAADRALRLRGAASWRGAAARTCGSCSTTTACLRCSASRRCCPTCSSARSASAAAASAS